MCFPEGCAFWGVVDNAVCLSGQIPQKRILEAWIGVLKPNAQKIITFLL